MIKDYQNKEVLAEMKRQVNAAAKISDRETARQELHLY